MEAIPNWPLPTSWALFAPFEEDAGDVLGLYGWRRIAQRRPRARRLQPGSSMEIHPPPWPWHHAQGRSFTSWGLQHVPPPDPITSWYPHPHPHPDPSPWVRITWGVSFSCSLCFPSPPALLPSSSFLGFSSPGTSVFQLLFPHMYRVSFSEWMPLCYLVRADSFHPHWCLQQHCLCISTKQSGATKGKLVRLGEYKPPRSCGNGKALPMSTVVGSGSDGTKGVWAEVVPDLWG